MWVRADAHGGVVAIGVERELSLGDGSCAVADRAVGSGTSDVAQRAAVHDVVHADAERVLCGGPRIPWIYRIDIGEIHPESVT